MSMSTPLNLVPSLSTTLPHRRPPNPAGKHLHSLLRLNRAAAPTPISGAAAAWSFEQRMEESLAVLDLMDSQSIPPEPSLFCTLLKSCAAARSLRFGRLIHRRAAAAGLHRHVSVANNLILMYSQCGLLAVARQVFDEMPVRDVVSWTTAISMYNRAGLPHDAVDLFLSMREGATDVEPNAFTYTVVLNACASSGNLDLGIRVHEDVIECGCNKDEFVVVALIDMYTKCGDIASGSEVFNGDSNPSVEACTAMIEGYTMNGESKAALELIREILNSRKETKKLASKIGFAALIKPCVMELALRHGQEVHAHMIKSGDKPSTKALETLIELYEKCDKLIMAYKIIDETIAKDYGLWSRMIARFSAKGMHEEALDCFVDMLSCDVRIDSEVVSHALKACIGLKWLKEGVQIHCRLIKIANLFKDHVPSELAELYTIFGKYEDACIIMNQQGRNQFG